MVAYLEKCQALANSIVNRAKPPSQIFIYEYDFKNQLLIDYAISLKHT